MLEVKKISKSFGRVQAVKEISLSASPGEIFGLLGPNGAGKTTTIRMIMNILGPDRGEIVFNGKRITEKDKDRIGYLPEERGLYKKVKVHDMLLYLAGRLRRRGMVIVFSDCLGDVDELTNSLQQLRLRGHDVLLFQIFAPEERSFTFRNPATFVDLEVNDYRLDVNPGVIRQQYLEQVDTFMSQLKANMIRIDCDLVPMTTDRDLGDTLHFALQG